jgi:hypothetical protein
MRRYSYPIFGAVLVLTLVCAGANEHAKTALLSDGLVLRAVEGTVAAREAGGGWSFTLRADYTLGKQTVAAQSCYEFLPSAALESLVCQVTSAKRPSYRLWARVTQYRGRNYLYLVSPYFSVLTDSGFQVPRATPSPRGDPNEGNALAIPEEVLALLKNDERPAVAKPTESSNPVAQDPLLLGRRGFIERDGDATFLVLDDLGRNISGEKLRLLPCRVRETIENRQARHAERLWFRVSGMQTRFQGQDYLLPYQAARLYGNGNLGGVDN